MSKVTFKVSINLGNGDTSIQIFNHMVTLEQYFTQSGSWDQTLAPGTYLISLAGTCPPGGNISIDIVGAKASKTLPITIKTAGPFLKGITITV